MNPATAVTLVEIAEALGISKRSAERQSNKESWPFEEVAQRGGRKRFYPIATLPKDVREALGIQRASAAAALIGTPQQSVAEVIALPVKTLPVSVDQPLKATQLDAEIARERIFQFVNDFEGSENRAIDHLNAGYMAGALTGPLTWAMDHAWGRRRADARLTRSTLAKWKAAKRQRGRAAPLVRQRDMAVKPWHALAVALKQRPQGSCLTWIVEQIAAQVAAGTVRGEAPGYDVVRRFFAEKFSQIDQLKGRHLGSALSTHKFYRSRSSEGMLPWDELHADGWNTHFTAPHPVTGEYVTYEVWHAHDVATRFVPPFGLGLTENFEVIAKCVENAVRAGGVMAILQTDSTRIVKNSQMFKTNPATSLADRVGFTIVHPQTVGNSQANGIAENFNAWLDRECRELATYQGKGMDSLALKRVKKLTGRAVKAKQSGDLVAHEAALAEAARMGKGRVFRTHEEACSWLEEKRGKWNDKPHRSLPKVRDAATGKLRHQSPNEALQQARDKGWAPLMFTEEYLQSMFLVHKQVMVRREAVTPYAGMRYHDECLGDWNGKPVVVAYDIMDWRQVWVKTLQGELICVAKFAESSDYRTPTAREAADEKRAKAQIKHRERQIETIEARVGLNVIEGECLPVSLPECLPVSAAVIPLVPRLTDAEMEAIEARQQPPKMMSQTEFGMWLYGDEIERMMQNDGGAEETAEPENEMAAV